MMIDLLPFSLFDLVERGGHFFAILEAHQVNYSGARQVAMTERETSIISRAATASMLPCRRLEVFHTARMLAQDLARCRTSHVHGYIAAADYQNLLPDGEPVTEIYI